jgi:chemotaxis protein methyltransferase CheR
MEDERLLDIELRVLLEAIYLRYHYDFRSYAMSSIRRRVAQAMVRFKVDKISDFQHDLLRDPVLFSEMLQYLTVQVSEMFRDPNYFKAINTQVFPVLATYPSIKIWVAGCSSGEEVWSLAILLKEAGLLERTIIYATDINAEALRKAESGTFDVDRISQFSRNYLAAGGRHSLSDYYTSAYQGAVFDRALKRQIVFADHSLATDAVFSEVHFVSCRNVLIYFNKQLQDRAVGLFHESLVPLGFLGLGSKEALQFGAHQNDFEPFVKEQKVFRKVA